MDADHLIALRQAASALISTAAAPTVLATLRTLLADPEFAWEADASPQRPSQPSTAPSSTEWDDLRQRVREARAARGVTKQALAETFGLALSTVDTALSGRRPPTKALMQRLEDWLAEEPAGAPEVAAYAATFPDAGASRVHVDTSASFATAD